MVTSVFFYKIKTPNWTHSLSVNIRKFSETAKGSWADPMCRLTSWSSPVTGMLVEDVGSWVRDEGLDYSGHGLPRWLSGKESACQCRRCGFHPWVRKIPWRRKWQLTPVFLPGKSHGQRSLAGCSPWGRTESDMTWQLNHSNNWGSTGFRFSFLWSSYLTGGSAEGPRWAPAHSGLVSELRTSEFRKSAFF